MKQSSYSHAEKVAHDLLTSVDIGDDIAPARTVGERYHLDQVTRTHRRRHRHSYVDGPLAAAEHLRRLPAPGETLHAITTGDFVGADIIPAILKLDGEATARECIITTLSFSRDNVDLFAAMLAEKRIRKLTLMASVYFRRTAINAAVYDYAEQQLDPGTARVIAARVHAKIILIATTTGHRWTVETSGNLRSCLCVEQLTISGDPKLYEFHRRWIRHVERQCP